MANSCKDCDRLQAKPSGTAPPRPYFQQATKYDHYANFQKFKQTKAEEQFINQRKEELLKFNTNFTNFHLSRTLSKEQLEKFGIRDIAKFRQQFKVGNCDHNNNYLNFPSQKDKSENNSLKETQMDNENENKSLQKTKSFLTLTRTPVICPISVCNRTIGVTFVLSHFLRDHNEDFGVVCQEIYTGMRSVLIFDPINLEIRENVCLGILAYGGKVNERPSHPTERGLCISNAFLPKPYEHLISHLPILIMACRTSWSSLFENNKEVERNIHNPNYINQELIVIWLVSVQTVKPIHCTVTLYNKSMTSSRSSIMKIRDLNDTQNLQEFIFKETNFIHLSHGEVNNLSQERNECIHMEIMINEYK